MKCKGLLLSTLVLSLSGLHASAATVCLSGSGAGNNYGPDSSCTSTETELKVKLNKSSGSTSGTGVAVGTNTQVDFSSSSNLDFASGFASIKPSSGSSFSSLDVSALGSTFDDIVFGLQFLKTGRGPSNVEDLTISWNGGSYTFSNIKANALTTFTLVSTGPLSFVDLSSTTGIKQAKHFEISSITTAIPEPSTWAMLALGFAALGFAGFRKRERPAISVL